MMSLSFKGDKLRNKFNSRLESEMDDLDSVNKSKYEDYDSRPIKPLDKTVFNKQLSEFAEVSSEELEQLKQRTMQHIRSKTAETGTKLPVQRNFAKTPPTKKLVFNSMASSVTNQSINTPTNQSKSQINSRVRRRTVDELKTNKTSTPPPNKISKLKITQQSNSPKPTTSNYLSHLNQNSSKIDTKTLTKQISSTRKAVKNILINTKTLNDSDEDNASKISTENISSNDEAKNRLKSDTNRTLNQMKHSEIHSRIQKQRQEMLLCKQKSLNEFKNQLRIKHEEEKKLELRNRCPKSMKC